jgi:hypothetical protein
MKVENVFIHHAQGVLEILVIFERLLEAVKAWESFRYLNICFQKLIKHRRMLVRKLKVVR